MIKNKKQKTKKEAAESRKLIGFVHKILKRQLVLYSLATRYEYSTIFLSISCQ